MYMYVSIIYTLCRHGAPMDLLDLCLPWACQVQHVAYVVGGRVGMELITMTRFAEGSTPPNPPNPPQTPQSLFLINVYPLPPRVLVPTSYVGHPQSSYFLILLAAWRILRHLAPRRPPGSLIYVVFPVFRTFLVTPLR